MLRSRLEKVGDMGLGLSAMLAGILPGSFTWEDAALHPSCRETGQETPLSELTEANWGLL